MEKNDNATPAESHERLKKLYSVRETLAEMGMSLTEDQEEQLQEAEENIIQNEILPLIAEKIQPILTSIKSDLVLMVDYQPTKPLTVMLTREREVVEYIEEDALKFELDPEVEHKEGSPRRKKRIQKKNRTILKVTLPDKTVIRETRASQTFAEVIKFIGVERVRNMEMTINHVPLVSNRIDPKYGPNQLPIGQYYVMTNSPTDKKKQLLDDIAKQLNLPITVEIVSAPKSRRKSK